MLYFGMFGSGTFNKPNDLWNGHIYEGEEMDIAEPATGLNMGDQFAVGMWVYIMDIIGTHTLWCKQTPTGSSPGISLCLRFDANKFFFTVKDCSAG